MGKEKLKTQLWAMVIAFFTGIGSMGCLITGMQIHIPEVGWVTGACAVSAVVFSLCSRRKLGWIPVCFVALLVGYFWAKGPLERSTEALIFRLTEWYDAGYGWGALYWTGEDPTLADPTQALCLIGVLVTSTMAWTVAGCHSGWLGIVVSCLPLGACMILTNTVPAEQHLFCLVAALILVFITQPMRRKDEKQGNTLTAMIAIPVVTSVLILFVLCPQSTYNGQDGADRLEQWVRTVLGMGEESPLYIGVSGDNSENIVSLDSVGPKTYQNRKVMSVIDERGGLLYLRGCAYDIYDGHSWSRSEGEWASDGNFSVDGKAWKVTVSTTQPHKVIYMPHVVRSKLDSFQGGRLENPDEKTRYQFVCTELPKHQISILSPSTPGLHSSSIIDEDTFRGGGLGGLLYSKSMAQYLQLPEETKKRARQWVEERLGSMPEAGSIQMQVYVYAVVELVKESATYDLQTRRMFGDADDFALWFLEDSDTGYCVHFATAATVLLRSIGVPARYVTGYLVQTKANTATNVRLRDAHAWVEIYDALNGWLTVDPTPSGFGSPVPVPTQPEATQSTDETAQPTETTEETVTMPIELPTQPEPTQPSQTTASNVGGADEPSLPPMITPEIPETPDKGPVWVLIPLVLVGAVFLQWRLRLWLRRKKQRIGTPNAQALACWQEAQLYRKLRIYPPEALEQIALKAKFSQHTVTRQELRQLDGFLARSRRRLRDSSLWIRLYASLILALI